MILSAIITCLIFCSMVIIGKIAVEVDHKTKYDHGPTVVTISAIAVIIMIFAGLQVQKRVIEIEQNRVEHVQTWRL